MFEAISLTRVKGCLASEMLGIVEATPPL